MNLLSRILFLPILVLVGCSAENDDKGGKEDSFDRKAMLVNWADHIIIPAFANFQSSTQNLEDRTTDFVEAPTEVKLTELRSAFEAAYIDFQTVSMFEIGKAEEINYRNFLNTYPANAADIQSKSESGNYNLELPSSYAEQGFPALDFLINGLADTDTAVISFYESNPGYKNYLRDVAHRINFLTSQVSNSWQEDFRDTFVDNTSSSSTGAVDRFTNDYVMYFEKFLRSGKIGYPAGAFTGEPSPENAEAYYSQGLSKRLYVRSLESVQDFFNGKNFEGTGSGPSYRHYLDYLDSMKDGGKLSSFINDQFTTVIEQASGLDESLRSQVETNNTNMLVAFDELQKQVVLLKLDMMQALSISVDYVDSDGD